MPVPFSPCPLSPQTTPEATPSTVEEAGKTFPNELLESNIELGQTLCVLLKAPQERKDVDKKNSNRSGRYI